MDSLSIIVVLEEMSDIEKEELVNLIDEEIKEQISKSEKTKVLTKK